MKPNPYRDYRRIVEDYVAWIDSAAFDGDDTPPSWRPVNPNQPTPRPDGGSTPVPTLAAPLRPVRVRLDGLTVTADLVGPAVTALAALGQFRPMRGGGANAGMAFTLGHGGVRLFASGYPGRGGTLGVTVKLEQQDVGVRPFCDEDAIEDLGYVVGRVGAAGRLGPDGKPAPWRLSTVDVAVDYPAWFWDLLVVTRARLTDSPDASYATTMYYGARGSRRSTKSYYREFRGDPVTRVERTARRPPAALSIGQLHHLAGLLDAVTVRPLWARVPANVAFLMRWVQLHGLVNARLPPRRDGVVLDPDGVAARWDELRAAVHDPGALGLVVQPGAAVRAAWPTVAALFDAAYSRGRVRGIRDRARVVER